MMTTWKSDVYHLLPMCHIYVEVRIKILTSECWLPYFEIFLVIKNRVMYQICCHGVCNVSVWIYDLKKNASDDRSLYFFTC
jgi:hypothetical protein